MCIDVHKNAKHPLPIGFRRVFAQHKLNQVGPVMLKKEGETKCKVQSCPSVRVRDLLVYSSMVCFNIWSETGFIK